MFSAFKKPIFRLGFFFFRSNKKSTILFAVFSLARVTETTISTVCYWILCKSERDRCYFGLEIFFLLIWWNFFLLFFQKKFFCNFFRQFSMFFVRWEVFFPSENGFLLRIFFEKSRANFPNTLEKNMCCDDLIRRRKKKQNGSRFARRIFFSVMKKKWRFFDEKISICCRFLLWKLIEWLKKEARSIKNVWKKVF